MKKKLLGLSLLTAISSQGNAFQLDTGDDWSIRWDNTLKFNAMFRTEKPTDQVNRRASAYWLAGQSNYSVTRDELGIVSTRFDILSEMDVIWRDSFGFRVSGSGWYDPQYEKGENDYPSDWNSNWASPSADVGDFNHEAEDLHYAGGELLDAFVFANFDIGETAIGVRAGRHTIYWGNSLLATGAVTSIGGAMAPLDFSKALSVPGSEAKELFMPTNKISTVMQFTDNLTFNAYYGLEHSTYRLPATGTFWSPGAGLTEDTEFVPFPPGPALTSVSQYTGYKGRNDQTADEEFGVNLQYYFEEWDLETSFIYLNYVDKNRSDILSGFDLGQFGTLLEAQGDPTASALMAAWRATCNGIPGVVDPFDCPNLPYAMGDDGAIVAGQHRWLYKEDNDLYGISFAKEIAGISFGLDIVYRDNNPLVIGIGAGLQRIYNAPDSPLFPSGEEIAAALGVGYIPGDYESYDSDNFLGPTGDIWTMVINGVGLLTGNAIWEGGSYIFEFTGSSMTDCNENCDLLDPNVEEDAVFTTFAGVFRPTWYQVWPGTDLTVPMTLSYVLTKEKSPFAFGGDQQSGNASIGMEFLIDQEWTVTGSYNRRFSPVNAGLGGLLKDRDNVSFTVKRTF